MSIRGSLIGGLTAACLALPCMTASGHEQGGALLDDTVTVAGQRLLLNGAGTGRKLMFAVYAIGLYLPARGQTTEQVLAMAGPRRLVITLLRDVDAASFAQALIQGCEGLDSGAGRSGSMAALDRLARAVAEGAADLRKGDTFTLDWHPDRGVVVSLNQKPVSVPVRDMDLYNTLLKIWLGDRPADFRLKTHLLGRAA